MRTIQCTMRFRAMACALSLLIILAGCAQHAPIGEIAHIPGANQKNPDNPRRADQETGAVSTNQDDREGTLFQESRALVGTSGGALALTLHKTAPDIYQTERLAGRLDTGQGQGTRVYQLTLSEPGQLIWTVQHNSAEGLLLAEVYRADESSPQIELVLRGMKEKSAALDAQPGTYSARLVVESCQTSVEYELLVTYDKNATADGATTIPLGGKDSGGQLNGRITDRTDWYRVKGPADDQGILTYVVEQKSGSPLVLEFYQQRPQQAGELQLLTPIALSLEQPGQKAAYAIATEPGGVYYAKVNLPSPEKTAAYAIRNSFQAVSVTAPIVSASSPELRPDEVSAPAPVAAADLRPPEDVDAVAPLVSEFRLELRQGEVIAAGVAQDNQDTPQVQMRVNGTPITPAGVVNAPTSARIEFMYALTEWLQPGVNEITAVAVDAAGNVSPAASARFEKPVIRIQAVAPQADLQHDAAGNVTRIATGADALTIRYAATSSQGLRQGQLTCRCASGCAIADDAAHSTSPQRAGRNVDDLMILATPPPSVGRADAQKPQPQVELSKTLILTERVSYVVLAAVDETGASTEYALTVVKTSPSSP